MSIKYAVALWTRLLMSLEDLKIRRQYSRASVTNLTITKEGGDGEATCNTLRILCSALLQSEPRQQRYAPSLWSEILSPATPRQLCRHQMIQSSKSHKGIPWNRVKYFRRLLEGDMSIRFSFSLHNIERSLLQSVSCKILRNCTCVNFFSYEKNCVFASMSPPNRYTQVIEFR